MHPDEQLGSQHWCSGELRQPKRAKWSYWGGGEEPVAQNSPKVRPTEPTTQFQTSSSRDAILSTNVVLTPPCQALCQQLGLSPAKAFIWGREM